MKSLTLAVLTTGLLCFSIAGQAQDMFLINFKGTCQKTDDSGAIVSEKINNKSLLQDAVTSMGVSNANNLRLVYAVNAAENNDLIEVIDTNNAPVFTNYVFFNTVTVENSDQTDFVRTPYVYTPTSIQQSSDPIGTANIHQKLIFNRSNGELKRTQLSGNLIYFTRPTIDSGPQACTASFTATKPVPALP